MSVTFTQETTVHHKVYVNGVFVGTAVDHTGMLATGQSPLPRGVLGVDWYNDRVIFFPSVNGLRKKTMKMSLEDAKKTIAVMLG